MPNILTRISTNNKEVPIHQRNLQTVMIEIQKVLNYYVQLFSQDNVHDMRNFQLIYDKIINTLRYDLEIKC